MNDGLVVLMVLFGFFCVVYAILASVFPGFF